MEETTKFVITLKNGDCLSVPKQILTADSRMFRYLIVDLKYNEHEIDDFSHKAVYQFLVFLRDKQLSELEDAMFRELHKLAVVFQVDWLTNSCRSWLVRKMDSATENLEITFLFDECFYILKQWDEKFVLQELVSRLALKDNSSFLSEYMSDIDKLETSQLDILLKLGGSNVDLFLRIILQNLTSQRNLNGKLKYLIQNMNLALCLERNEELYLHVFDTLSNLSEISVTDLRSVFKMMSDTVRSVSLRKVQRKKTVIVVEERKDEDIISTCKTLNDVAEAVSDGRITSMFEVVDIILYILPKNTPIWEDMRQFVTTLENICRHRQLIKISRQHLDIVIGALLHSRLDLADQVITLLQEIKDNDKLSTYHENVVIKRGVSSHRDKGLYKFKHPGIGACTKSDSSCGFILKTRYGNDLTWRKELCTDSEDYDDTGIHFHDIVSAHEMFPYSVASYNVGTGNKVTLACRWGWYKDWLPYIADWDFEGIYIMYNVTDYLVAKPE